jgi:hypothetical protein
MHKIQANDDNSLFAEHLGKYRSLFPSLALIFHLIELADEYGRIKNAGNLDDLIRISGPQVSLKHALMAEKWCKYLESHAIRIYGLIKTDAHLAAFELAKKILKEKIEGDFTAKQVYQKGWQYLTKVDVVKDAIEYLIANNWIFEVRPEMPTNGRPTAPIYTANPRIFKDNVLLS